MFKCGSKQVLPGRKEEKMKKYPVILLAILLITAGTVVAEGRGDPGPLLLELTEDQIAIIVHNCPGLETVSIELTEDQIAIIVHNFPQVEIEELNLGLDHLREDNTVELVLEGRTGVTPLSRNQ